MYSNKIVSFVVFCVLFMQFAFSNVLSLPSYAAEIVSGSVDESVEPTTQTDVEPKIESKMIGDVNGDGKRNSIDFAMMRMVLLAIESEFPVSNGVWASDIDRNGVFNSIDFAYMRQFLLGIISNFPTEKPYETPFSYALFSGDKESTLYITGDKVSITGDIHSNSSIVLGFGYEGYINGSCRAVTEVIRYSEREVCDKIITHVDEIEMPNLSKDFNTTDAIRFSYDELSTSGEKLYKRYLEPGSDYLLSKYGDELKVSYDVHAKTWNLDGDTLNLNEEKPYFFNGNVIISVDNVVGNGIIVAEDDITLNPGYLEKSELGLYSISGGIVCNLPSGAVFTGLLYAPGSDKSEDKAGLVSGNIHVRSTNFEFNGSIVGKRLDLTGDKVIKYERTSIHKAFQILD